MDKGYFITGIGTGVGKTIISTILTEKLKADYWKPIQSGDLDKTDSMTVKSLISNTLTVIHPEKYKFSQPLSPHLSASRDGITISVTDIRLPETSNLLIVEGAGGLMVPLNDTFLMTDLIRQLNLSVILVSRNYLGSINHTLLSISLLKQLGVPIKGIIFNGTENRDSQDFILNYSKINFLGHIGEMGRVCRENISRSAKSINLAP